MAVKGFLATVNRRVVGSSPTSGAITSIESMKWKAAKNGCLFYFVRWLFWWLFRFQMPRNIFCGAGRRMILPSQNVSLSELF